MFNGKYISVNELIYRIKRNRLLSDVNYSDIAMDIMDLVKMVGAPIIYESKIETIPFVAFRTEIPKDMFYLEHLSYKKGNQMIPLQYSVSHSGGKWNCISERGMSIRSNMTYSIKRNYIYLDVESGVINIEYKAIVVDENGMPMIPDNVHLIKAIESYVKVQHFIEKDDMGDMHQSVLQRAEREYAWHIAAAETAFKMPSEDEMEVIRNGLVRFISNYRANAQGFEYGHLNRVNP